MDWITEVFNKNFDMYFMVLVILGNNILFDMLPQKILEFYKSKTYLTTVSSLIMGIGYFYLDKYFRIEAEPVNPKVLINSFLLSTTLYEMGFKEIINFIKENGKNFLLKKAAEKLEIVTVESAKPTTIKKPATVKKSATVKTETTEQKNETPQG
jgi:hypothetical protein